MSDRAGYLDQPSSKAVLRQRVPLSDFSLCMATLLAVQYWAGTVALVARVPDLGALSQALTQISVLPVVEWYMLIALARRLPERTISPAMAYGSLALFAAASTLIAHQRFAFLLETFVLFLAWIRTPDLKRIGLILFLIALQRGQGLAPLHALVSSLDAQIVGALMPLIGQPVTQVGNLIMSNGMPDGLVILAGCASTNLMLPMGVGLAILLLTSRERLRRTEYGWIALTLAIAVAINIARLILMLGSHAAYKSWHEGTGESIVSVGGLIVTMGIWMMATDPRRAVTE
jgi:hypothetical protein